MRLSKLVRLAERTCSRRLGPASALEGAPPTLKGLAYGLGHLSALTHANGRPWLLASQVFCTTPLNPAGALKRLRCSCCRRRTGRLPGRNPVTWPHGCISWTRTRSSLSSLARCSTRWIIAATVSEEMRQAAAVTPIIGSCCGSTEDAPVCRVGLCVTFQLGWTKQKFVEDQTWHMCCCSAGGIMASPDCRGFPLLQGPSPIAGLSLGSLAPPCRGPRHPVLVERVPLRSLRASFQPLLKALLSF